MHSTGFEPAHTNIFELESNPLDQLGHKCVYFDVQIFAIYTVTNCAYHNLDRELRK